jgi:hypothetical protein
MPRVAIAVAFFLLWLAVRDVVDDKPRRASALQFADWDLAGEPSEG